MNYAVTMTAWRRPHTVARALRALDIAGLQNCMLYVSIDYHDDESWKGIVQAVEQARFHGLVEKKWRVNNPPFGLWPRENNAYQTYEWAFSEGADAVLALEDDCVLSVDALQMTEWFLAHFARKYLFLSFANGNRCDDVLGKEMEVVESAMIDSPWAWAFSREAWEKTKPWWNCKQLEPKGWDWSLTTAMAINKWISLCPVMSRAKNIGRENGATGGLVYWDENLKHSAFSDGTFGCDYKVQTVPNLQHVQYWMASELDALMAKVGK